MTRGRTGWGDTGEMEGRKGEQENRSVRIKMFERNKEIKEEGVTGERLRGRR